MDATRHPLSAARRVKTRHVAVISGGIAWTLAACFTTGRLDVNQMLAPSVPVAVSAAEISEGQRLFDHETFGGNGRTCRTCHSSSNGTISPEEVAKRLAENPSDPLFLHDGLDDFRQRNDPDCRSRNDSDRTRTAAGSGPRG